LKKILVLAVLSQRLTGQPEADMDSVSAHIVKRKKLSIFYLKNFMEINSKRKILSTS